MVFSITTNNGTGMEFNSKEEFFEELEQMISNCFGNGGTEFDVSVETDASCFAEEDEEDFIDSVYHNRSEDELRAMGAFDNLNNEEEI